ncbi:hypothetical protein A4G18_06605 [Pasteurellaceae bacterium Pebbles2]|nr:hypothetical protein [Pasteurellaceae bacterium Pebbles2]
MKSTVIKWSGVAVLAFATFLFLWQYLAVQKSVSYVELPENIQLEAGDWIFRSGVDFDSKIIKHTSQSPYSHIGIIVATQPEIFIAHAIDNDNPEQPNQVIISSFKDFSASNRTNAIGIARPRILNQAQRQATAEYAAQQKGKAFELRSREESPFYCSILLLDAIQHQQPNFNPTWQYIDVAVFRGEYLFPEAFRQMDIDWIFRYEVTEE